MELGILYIPLTQMLQESKRYLRKACCTQTLGTGPRGQGPVPSCTTFSNVPKGQLIYLWLDPIGCLSGLCGVSGSSVCEAFRISCQDSVWVCETPIEKEMRCYFPLLREVVLAPCRLPGSSQFHFWALFPRLCRQRLLYKDVGIEAQVYPLA